ncbi:MAG: hypothetical protein CL885_02795 [Dehalococcoidia bacterium]|nr:hypothetical protein [Dehalococcoidia bacterium]
MIAAHNTGAEITLSGGYRNNSKETEFIWLPFPYRTGTPTRPGDSKPVGTFSSTKNRFFIYTRSRDLQYIDIVFELPPGEKLSVSLIVNPGKRLTIKSIGIPTNIPDVISYKNPVLAAEIEW